MSQNNDGVYQVDGRLSTSGLREADLLSWVQRILAGHPPHVWLLSGPLGAGKTTLVQTLGKALGVTSAITSPTFSLQKIHPLSGQAWDNLVHLDAYRLHDEREIAALELPEHLANPQSLVVVEWPERLPTIDWGACLRITLTPGKSPQVRDILVTIG